MPSRYEVDDEAGEVDPGELAELYKRRRRLVLVVIATIAVIIMAIATRDSEAGSSAQVATLGSEQSSSTVGVLGTTVAPSTLPVAPATSRAAASSAPTTLSPTETTVFRRPMTGNVNVSLKWDCYDCVDWPTLRGKHHPAVDYVSNDPAIYATADGVVTKMNTGCGGQGCGNSYGNWLFLKHTLSDGTVLYSFYAHLASFTAAVVDGACIRGGQRVGTMGNTGIASAAHLHFNVQNNTNLLEYTTQSTAVFGSRDPDTLYGKVKVRPC